MSLQDKAYDNVNGNNNKNNNNNYKPHHDNNHHHCHYHFIGLMVVITLKLLSR